MATSLPEALRLRHFLAREYFRERAAAFTIEAGCLAMLEELQVWQEQFRRASEGLTELMRPIGERFGITSEAIAGEAERMVAEAEAPPG